MIEGITEAVNSSDELTNLVNSAQKGSPQAFEALVRRFQKDVRLFVMRHIGSVVAVDDVAQEVFVRMHSSILNYRGSGEFKSWLLGIARNRVLTFLRNEQKRKRREKKGIEADLAIQQLVTAEDDRGDIEATQKDIEALKSCIEHLNEDHSDLIERYYFNQQSAESIASKVGRKPSSVRMALLRIRKSLGKCIRQKREKSNAT